MIDGESGAAPDEAECDEARQIQWFLEIEPAHQELDGRIDVHEDPGEVVRDLADAAVEQGEGNRRDDSGQWEQQELCSGQHADASGSVDFTVDAEEQCCGRHHQGFCEK